MDGFLCNLSTELLINIFKYLPLNDLLTLRLVCHRFNRIITSGLHLLVKNDLLVTNQIMPEFRARSKMLLNMLDKIRISKNWRTGRYYKCDFIYKERRKSMPWLSLEKDRVWVSRGRYVKCYKRSGRSGVNVYSLTADSTADVSKFVCKQNFVISGLGDGSIWIWTPNHKKRHYKNCHKSDVNAVDLNGAIFASGSRDKLCKLWSLNLEDPSELSNIYSIRMKDRVWCTGFSPGGQYLLIGTAGCNAPAAYLTDVESKCKMGYIDRPVHQIGAGILDIKWESPNIVWTGGYDTCLRRWDLRMNGCVQHWEDPYLSTIYCLDYDNYCTAITGVQTNGRAVLWDTRKPVYAQMYFVDDKSPLYSLAFDATHLYTATECSVHVLDFTDSKMQCKDYSNHFSRTIIA